MRTTPLWMALALASLATCVVSIHAHAGVADGPACRAGIPELPESTLPPEPLMSSFPRLENYEVGVEYPSSVRDRAVRWAKVFEVPASWLISLGYVESRNQPMAKNESGATGALQIKLARARDLVTWLNRSKWKVHREVQEILSRFWGGMRDDLLNLDLNIMLAAFELHHLMRRFGHDHQVVSAAYNQGEGRIARCLERGLPLPDRAIEFIARIERARQLGYA
jgi:soluble lytic murein transglycosylase-like protein